MKISDLLKLSTDNLRRRKGRTALTVIGVVVGTCAIVVMISLGIATNKRTDEMLSTWSDLTQITAFGYSEKQDTPALDDKMVLKFQEMDNVVAATPMYQFESMQANVVAGKRNRYSMYMWNTTGMNISAIEPMGIELLSGSYLSGESVGKNKIPVLVGEETAYQFEDTKKSWRNPDRMRWKELDAEGNVIKPPFFDITKEKLTMQMQYAYDDQGVAKTKDYELVVVGVVKTNNSKQETRGIIMNIEDMKKLEAEYKKLSKGSGMGGGSSYMMGGSGNKVEGYNQVYIKVDEVDNVGTVEKAIKDIGYTTSSMTQIRQDMQKQVASGQMMLGGLAAVSLLVAALNIANTMTMAIYERTKEIGVMKVLGCRLSKIRGMFLIESGAIGFLGGIVGCVFSCLISFVLNNFTSWMGVLTNWLLSMGIDITKNAVDNMGGMGMGMGGMGMGMGDMGAGGVMSIIPFWLYLAALIFATVVGILSGIAPANRAVKISALEAIRHE